MKKIIALFCITAFVSSCASVPMGDPALDAALKTFPAPKDKAGIYIYRNESIGAAVKMYVAIDGNTIGQTGANTYLYTEVAPGTHAIRSSAENTDTINISAIAGQLSYVWQEVKMGIISARTKLHLVSEEEGQKGVRDTKLAAGM
jgi:hypothetical protein